MNEQGQLICCVQVMLADLVCHVPQLLEHLPPVALGQLLASCASLRSQVHEHVTNIRCAMDCHDVRVLTTGLWPRLTHLELGFSKTLDAQSVSTLAKATHLQLQRLNLSYSKIDSCLCWSITGGGIPRTQVSPLGRQQPGYANDIPS